MAPTTLVVLFLLAAQAFAMSTPSKVLVTGANGYLGSHIVKQLLEKNYAVHAAVRDANSPRVSHLLELAGAEDRLNLFSIGDLATANFDESMKGCSAVFHTATPLTVKFDENDGKRDIYDPAMKSTQQLLDCVGRHVDTVKCIVLTSSMSAAAPYPEPQIKDESCWSDSGRQKGRDNWYGATKTDQERLVQMWVEDAKTKGAVAKEFKLAAICPTMIIGPALNISPDVTGTMGTLLGWLQGKKSEAPNDSMSFVHVCDCAAMHVAAMENPSASGRYMSLIESWHWNDIARELKRLNPSMPEMKLYDGDDVVTPTKFNLDKMNSLGIKVKSVQETLEDSVAYLKKVGSL